MSETPTAVNEVEDLHISARGWTKIVLTIVLGTALFIVLNIHLGDVAQAAYNSQFDDIMTERGGNILAANGEGQIASIIWPMMTLLFLYGVVAIVVQILVSLVWRKKSDPSDQPQVERDIIRIK